MKIKEIGLYLVVISFLIVGIYVLWPKKVNKNTELIETNTNSEVKVFKGKDEVKTVNIFGTVVKWDGKEDILTIDDEAGKKVEFEIDPLTTKVSLVRSQNLYKDTELYVVNKALQPMHWSQAFCESDSVSLMINSSSGAVEWIMNTGRRMCGFKEDF